MPLFPAGIIDPYDVHNYKHILYRGIRFDEVLLGMVAQAGGVWRVETERFWLHGFSGGGQFAHRFLYLHPQRLHGVSIGAPGGSRIRGCSTGSGRRGWRMSRRCSGSRLILRRWRASRCSLWSGEKDTDGSALGKDDKAGTNRVERVRYLQGALEEIGVSSELTVVGGVGHDGVKCLPTVEGWLNNKFSEINNSQI
ncbi:hypothetical protein B0H14DRAFT_54885 [Mycena olivaceomarginata]|nr:hypothetical protein B0H14DRAFT_54885 [Mycena olivaceomarginata]